MFFLLPLLVILNNLNNMKPGTSFRNGEERGEWYLLLSVFANFIFNNNDYSGKS